MRRPAWLAGTLIAVAVLAALGAVVFIPFLLHPSLSNADLSGVTDVKERITLLQAQPEGFDPGGEPEADSFTWIVKGRGQGTASSACMIT
jgi:hypothetical protein